MGKKKPYYVKVTKNCGWRDRWNEEPEIHTYKTYAVSEKQAISNVKFKTKGTKPEYFEYGTEAYWELYEYEVVQE